MDDALNTALNRIEARTRSDWAAALRAVRRVDRQGARLLAARRRRQAEMEKGLCDMITFGTGSPHGWPHQPAG